MRMPSIPVTALVLLIVAAGGRADAAGSHAMPIPHAPSGGALTLIRAKPVADLRPMIRQAIELSDAGHFDEATALLDKAIELNRARGRKGAAGAQFLLTLKARILIREGRFDAAETLLKGTIEGIEQAQGRSAELNTVPFSMLGELYMSQARFAEAEPLLVRAVALSEQHAGRNNPATADLMNSLAVFYLKTAQNDKAEPLLQRVLAIYKAQKKSVETDMSVAAALLNLGVVEQQRQDYDKALEVYQEAYQLDVDALGADHPDTIRAANNIAVLYNLMGRHSDALPMLQKLYDAALALFGPDNPQTAHAQNNLGWTELQLGDFERAQRDLASAFAIYAANRALQKQDANGRGAAVDEREVGRTILGLMSADSALAAADASRAGALTDEAFQAAQQVHRGKAAEALSLTTARFSVGDTPLAALIRQRQDLAATRAEGEAWLTASVALPARQRDATAEQETRKALAEIAARIEAISADIQAKFPDYASLADPKPLSIAEAQQLLGPDDALVLLAPFGGQNGEAMFTFVVTRDQARWQQSDAGQTSLTERVRRLRCGLDVGAWGDKASAALCSQLTGQPSWTDGEELPFDAGESYRLFTTLFGNLAPMIEGKTLYVVAPDPLASLPFQVLVTRPPANDHPAGRGYAGLAWLGRSNGIAVLPSASGLRATRDTRSTESASKPYVGYGDPTLTGDLSCGSAPLSDVCPTLAAGHATPRAALIARAPRAAEAVVRGGLADADAVRSMCPLPETALELRCVAESVRSPADTVHIGADATVPAVEAAALDQYRIIHFATHGLLPGDIESDDDTVSEPALVLTPPAQSEPGNDGLLRASAIAALKLNADWVVLSACNTAAGSSLGGESMSGLASAFFYAGARALLVSHWPVRSDAAVLLTTGAFSEMAANPSIGRAVAMRDAMTALIDDPSGDYAHPSVWAPFAVVGQGGPARL